MSRQTDTSRPLDLDALNKPSGPHTYEVSPGNSVLRFLRDVKAAARTAASVACLGFAACATTASGKATIAPPAPAAAVSPAAPGGHAAGVPAPFPFRGDGHRERTDEESLGLGGPVFAEAALAVARPIKGSDGNHPALNLDVGVDPVNGDFWNEHAQLGGRFRAARASEKVDTVNDAGKTVATGGEITGNTFCGFLRGAWTPEIARRVRAVLGGGPGLCHAQAMETGPNSDIPAATGVAGEVDAGIQVGGQNFGGKAGWEATFGGQDAFQAHGPFLGLYGRF